MGQKKPAPVNSQMTTRNVYHHVGEEVGQKPPFCFSRAIAWSRRVPTGNLVARSS